MIEIVSVPGYTGHWQVMSRTPRTGPDCRICGTACDLVSLRALGDDRRMGRQACGLVQSSSIESTSDARTPAAWSAKEE